MPKPADWEEHIDVCGYFSLHEGRLTTYQPPEDLRSFLAAGAPFPSRTHMHAQLNALSHVWVAAHIHIALLLLPIEAFYAHAQDKKLDFRVVSLSQGPHLCTWASDRFVWTTRRA